MMEYITEKWTTHRVAGVYYHRGDAFQALLRLKQLHRVHDSTLSLDLVRDPNNRYDKNAIKVLEKISGSLIGWVPKAENANLAMMMDKMPIKVEGRLTIHSNFDDNRLHMTTFLLVPESMAQMRNQSMSGDQLVSLWAEVNAKKADHPYKVLPECEDDDTEDDDTEDDDTEDDDMTIALLAQLKTRDGNQQQTTSSITATGRAALANLGVMLHNYDLDI